MASSRAEGRRQEELTKERQRMREQYEKQKAALVEETEKARPSSNRFVGQNDSMEESLKRSTVGLVRLEEFQARRKEIQEAKEREAAMTNELRYVFLAWRSLLCASLKEEAKEGTVHSKAVAPV
jgi:protein FAM50